MARKRPTASVIQSAFAVSGDTLRALAAGTIVVASSFVLASPAVAAVSPPLGVAEQFAVLGGSAVSNTGGTVITGDVGVSPGSSISGFPPGQVTGTVYNSGPVATAAQADIGTAYGSAAGEACGTDLSGLDLGGMTLPPGVYCFASSAQLTGVLRLDAQGSPTAQWLIKTTSSLTTASNAAVILVNGAPPECHNNITWLIGSSATIGSGSIFLGNIIANTSITLATGAGSMGSLYAHTGAVTMDTSKVGKCAGAIPPPPPLSISTVPSQSVPVGGTISDSATVDGGLSPTGNVTFKLYAPTDPACTAAPVATLTGALVNRHAVSGDAPATAEGTYNWVATYEGDANNAPKTSPCGDEPVLVTPARTLTGRAYGLTATSTLLGIPLVNVAPTPDTGHISTSSSSTTTTPCRAALPGLVSAHVLCANVTTDANASRSSASASVADALVASPAVTTGAVQSTSTTTCAGSSGTTTIAYLKVAGTVVIAQPTNIPPNTGVNVGTVSLVLNEQIPFTTPDAGLTVNAVHVRVSALGLATTNVVIASSESDIGGCP